MLEKIIRNLKNPRTETTGSYSLFQEAIEKMQSEKSLLFYPSSGWDTGDLYFTNGDLITELNGYSPSVYVHSDYMCNRDYNAPYEIFLEESGRFRIRRFFKLVITHDAEDRNNLQIASEARVEIYELDDLEKNILYY